MITKPRKRCKKIRERRQEIDKLNSQILKLLNTRAEKALDIGRIKVELGLPLYSPDREKEVLKKIASENQGPLENAAVQRIFKLIIAETRKLEKEVQENGGSNET